MYKSLDGLVRAHIYPLIGKLLGKNKHQYISYQVKPHKEGNVLYGFGTVRHAFCIKCRETKVLIGRTIRDLSFQELYSCPGSSPNPENSSGKEGEVA